jgi:hypothetical protein
LELSADAYIERLGLPTSIDARLSKKLLDVTDDLVTRSKLTKQQAHPVRQACQGNSFLAASITTMNQYVHNPYSSPQPTDLRATWDSLQPFVIAVWTI